MKRQVITVLGSVALASCLVSPLMAFKSAEYYATHNEECKRVLKKCDDLAVSALQQGKDLSKEQKSMCGNAEWGQRLYSERLRTQRAKVANQKRQNARENATQILAKCYTKMANGLESGVDYLKKDKTCKSYVERSITQNPLGLYGSGIPHFPLTTQITWATGDKIKLIRCYRLFAQNLAKNQSYEPLGKLHSECQAEINALF
ncbi:hypothetical protein [Helicobacter suis]|uniref:hypothetical protein n=1 Tax=Helicobacter suis TaxID=104628 RepID=UPI0011454D0D|nr:hypothetical protein [Helicobacter suis]